MPQSIINKLCEGVRKTTVAPTKYILECLQDGSLTLEQATEMLQSNMVDEVAMAVEAALEEVEQKEIVICAAVMAEDGTIYRGHRHGDAMQVCAGTGRKLFNGREQQGFITSKNRYVSREEGRKLQDAAGIPSADPEGYRGKTLFSEDLY